MKKRLKTFALLKLSVAAIVLFTGVTFQSTGQTSIVINEVSQGTSGSQEYVEFLVTGPALVNCDDTPPCIDLRLWVFDDNNGYLNGSPTTGVGIAAGACRFSNDPFWSCIPAGTMILIYNDNDPNPGVPVPDLSMVDGNCALAVPISSNLFDKHTSLPNSSNSSYVAAGWVSGGSWTNISMANGQDGFQIYDPANLATPVYSLGWGTSNSLGDIYMGAGSATGDVFYSIDCNYFNQASWAQGSASTDQTAGAPNTPAQEDCIGNMNANCNPPTVVIVTTPTTCVGCDGSATATITGGTPPYTLTWAAAPGGGQGTVNATGLCVGGYTLTLIDDNGTGCQLVTPATVVAGGVDPTPPTINCPGNLVATCSIIEEPAYTNLAAFQAVGGTVNDAESGIDLTSFVLLSEVSDANTCPELVTRTYQISDNCGNLNTCQQIISVDDNILPTASNPASIAVECIADVPLADPLVVIDEADNCSVPTVLLVSEVSDGLSCPETITRTYSVTDACGNTINVIHTITVDDITLPTASNPAPIAVECIADVPLADPLVVIDEADNCFVPTVLLVSEVSDGLSCPETITRTYSVTDACGNTINVIHTITVDDITLPTASNPAPIAVECIADVPLADPLVVIDEADNCSVPTVLLVSEVSDGLSCPETITRTYSVTDACGNTINVIHTITVDDITLPTASNPAPIAVECIADVPLADPLVVIDEADNCFVPTVLLVSEVSDGLSCPETITRTYSVTDACGNTINVIHTITVDDITLPTASNPAPIAVECIADVPLADPLVVIDEADNCFVPTVLLVSEVSDGLSCPETITRTYSVTDACGNSINVIHTITVDDITLPTASNPAPIAVECIADVPLADPLVVIDEADNCFVPTVLLVSEVSDGLSCPETITRTYSVTDACGNTINVIHTITVDDITLPTASNPAPIAVECIADVPLADPLVVIDEADNCFVPTVLLVSEVSDGLSCPETITRTYSVTDACGNSINVFQTITVDDTTPPTASNPTDIFLAGGLIPAPDPFLVIDEADNCDPTPTVVWVSDVSDGGVCPETITRTYSVTDDCGNTINVVQLVVIGDAFPPTASNPASIGVECSANIPLPDPLIVIDEVDNTGIPIVAWLNDATDGLNCPETITRTYSVTDDCGNVIFVTQIITVNDITPPTASNPIPTAVECLAEVPVSDPLVVIDEADNCTLGPVVAFVNEVSDGLSCPETITRTYSVTDDCGNSINVTQTITVDDITPPSGSAPANFNVQCTADVPLADPLLILDEADNCSVPTVSFVSDVSDGNSCPEIITRTYSITDDCGNTINVIQIITINDVILPTGTAPSDIVVQCLADVPLPDAQLITDEADNCSISIVLFGSDVSDGLSCPETITRTYSITDACGNTINVIQTITVDDTTPPSASNPTPVAVECIASVPVANPLVVIDEADNCTVAPIVAFVNDVSNGLSCPETIIRTYSITDMCGNETLVTQTIIVDDITPPTGTIPANVSVECIGDVPANDPLLIIDEADNCLIAPTVAFVGDVSDGLSCPETITRTYSITDACGNQLLVSQTIIIDDITPPTGTAPANVSVECIGDVPTSDPLLITDEADNCLIAPTVAFVGDVSDGLSCPETITRTYSITDLCGNQTIVTQGIVVDDITPPTASNPLPISVPGQNDIPPVDVTVVIDEADNCTVNPIVTWVSDVSDGNICNLEKITRTFLVTDDCGNTTMVEQTITILAVPPPIDAGPNQTICAGELVTIQEINPTGATIIWNPVLPPMPTAPSQTTTYSVIADNFGCISTDDVTIIVEALPLVSFFGDVLTGCEPLAVSFMNTSTASTDIVDCIWNIEGVAPISGCGSIGYTFENAGTYDITLTTTSINGCTNSVTYTDYIYVEGTPLASFSASTTELSILNTDVEFTNNSVGASNYIWDFGDNSGVSSVVDPTHTYGDEELTGYVVELIAYTPLGCSDTAWLVLNVTEEVIYYVPNSFTPDGDGYNQNFQAIFTLGYDPYDFSMLIFNRWGEIIWESHNDEVGWDGTYDGKLVQDGTYTWKIEFKTTETDERVMIKGHVNVLR